MGFVLDDFNRIADEKREQQVTVTTGARVSVFAAVVPQGVKRYIIDIIFSGDGAARTVQIERLDRDTTTHTMLYDGFHVPASDNRSLGALMDTPSQWPVITLFEGENLTLNSSAGAPEATVIYADSHPRQ